MYFKTDFLLYKFNIFAAVFGQLVIFGNSGYIAFPAGQGGKHGLCLFKKTRNREVLCYLAVNFIAGADLNFIKVRKRVNNRKHCMGRTLNLAAVFGGYTVKPAHSARSARGSAVFAAVQGRKDVGGIVGQMEPYMELALSEDLATELQTLHDLVTVTLSDTNIQNDDVNAVLTRMQSNAYSAAQGASNLADHLGGVADTAIDATNEILNRIDYSIKAMEPIMSDLNQAAVNFSLGMQHMDNAMDNLEMDSATLGELHTNLDQMSESLERINVELEYLAYIASAYFNKKGDGEVDLGQLRPENADEIKDKYGYDYDLDAGSSSAKLKKALVQVVSDLIMDTAKLSKATSKVLAILDDYYLTPIYDTDGDGIREKDGVKLTIRWLTYPSRQELPLLAESAQATLKDIGIDVDINCTANRREFLADMTSWDIYASAMVTAPSGDPQYFFTSCCVPGMSYNFGAYENTDVNAMIDELATEFDTEKRGELAVKLQQTILDDNAYVFCSFLQMNMISKSTVTGYTAHACDYYQVTADLDING